MEIMRSIRTSSILRLFRGRALIILCGIGFVLILLGFLWSNGNEISNAEERNILFQNGKQRPRLVSRRTLTFGEQTKNSDVNAIHENVAVIKQEVNHRGRSSVGATPCKQQKIVILSLLHDSADHLPHLEHVITSLSYPKACISVVFGEEDSTDDTVKVAKGMLDKLRGAYRRVALHQLQLEKFRIDFKGKGPNYKHAASLQHGRRRHIALARNMLMSYGLRDEDFMLWVDSDITSTPSNLMENMIGRKKDILVPRCAIRGKTWEIYYDFNTWRETEESRKFQEHVKTDILFLESYGQPRPRRLYLDDLRNEGEVVEVDGVGACVLLVNATLYRQGLVFPPFTYKHQIETEGFARMAQDMGFRLWGMPWLTVYHSCNRDTISYNCTR